MTWRPPCASAGPRAVPSIRAAQGRGTPAAAYAPLPESGLREAWSAGLVDSWEGQIRHGLGPGARGSGGAELDKLVWQAQNRVLLPLIDDALLHELVEALAGF
ncbi:hypothetical protein [Kitasatospora sp. NPDC057541]|uniref:hypothetical protein n=1 Tax=unclassified Kitasatospora TaxID=2633591 RepID=UPI0036BA956E